MRFLYSCACSVHIRDLLIHHDTQVPYVTGNILWAVYQFIVFIVLLRCQPLKKIRRTFIKTIPPLVFWEREWWTPTTELWGTLTFSGNSSGSQCLSICLLILISSSLESPYHDIFCTFHSGRASGGSTSTTTPSCLPPSPSSSSSTPPSRSSESTVRWPLHSQIYVSLKHVMQKSKML